MISANFSGSTLPPDSVISVASVNSIFPASTAASADASARARWGDQVSVTWIADDALGADELDRIDAVVTTAHEHGYATTLVDAPDGICRGCNMQLSSSFASEMLHNPETIYVCERCGRFLIHHIG